MFPVNGLVAFSYPTRPRVTIFKDLTFEIEPGMNVSIVGPSGGGKSTISISSLSVPCPFHSNVLLRRRLPPSPLLQSHLRQNNPQRHRHLYLQRQAIPPSHLRSPSRTSSLFWHSRREHRIWPP